MYRSNTESFSLEYYSDADFGGCLKTVKDKLRWPTTEAELVAANESVKEIVWLNRLFRRIARVQDVPILKIDNSAAIRLAQNPEFHRRTKHISNKHFFIREQLAEERLGIQHVSTWQQGRHHDQTTSVDSFASFVW
ncbi:hypothetical protein GWI33_021345 [Rhynchophorus ferrugineus]|uniref:Uncharacterized protein n=1 Tax=Rhynchophorus ferrugineus TaxID=354439 RepID=A0A834HQQ8_RHYFE|nr:hypothetical protein GWI33_021345 [Rhynchophorus ferrugineus]